MGRWRGVGGWASGRWRRMAGAVLCGLAAAGGLALAARQAAPPPEAAPPLPRLVSAPAPRWRVGVQAGHWLAADLPDEQAHLRDGHGATHAGVEEREINLALARLVVALLAERGVRAELLPARVPPAYQADAFVSLHADYAPGGDALGGGRRGYKIGLPWRASPAASRLHAALSQSFAATGQPRDDGVNATMRGYYAFNHLRYEHAVAPTTPAVIVEAGFLTDPADLARLTEGRAALAATVADGIMAYLEQRDPADRAALVPPALPLGAPRRPLAALAAPEPGAAPVLELAPGALLWTVGERGGWYQAVLPPDWELIGWVPAAELEPLPDAAFRAWRPPP